MVRLFVVVARPLKKPSIDIVFFREIRGAKPAKPGLVHKLVSVSQALLRQLTTVAEKSHSKFDISNVTFKIRHFEIGYFEIRQFMVLTVMS